MNLTLINNNNKYLNENFILFATPIIILTSISMSIPLCICCKKLFIYLKNKYRQSRSRFYSSNNLNSSLIIVTDSLGSRKSISSLNEDTLPSYNDIYNSSKN